MWIKYIENKDEIIIVRVYGDVPDIKLPDRIDNKIVTGLYKYCFSKKDKTDKIQGVSLKKIENISDETDKNNPDETKKNSPVKSDISDKSPNSTESENSEETGDINELLNEINNGIVTDIAGDFLEKISLPEGIRVIGDYCFYQCKNLHTISMGSGVIELGSDVFMNCEVLHTIIIRTSIKNKTSLRQIMTFRTQETDVFFDDAAIQFPEVNESYELIGPAHIFELNVKGQGIRVRQCFENDIFRFDLYDRIFEQAINTEDERMLCRMAAYRLKFPQSIRDEFRSAYESFLTQHIDILSDEMISRRDLTLISDLFKLGLLEKKQTDIVLTKLSRSGWLQGTTEMIALVNSRC